MLAFRIHTPAAGAAGNQPPRIAAGWKFIGALALCPACGSDDPTGSPEVQRIVGDWVLTDSLLNYPINRPIRCISGRGVLNVQAADQGFRGSLTDDTKCLMVTDTSATGERSGLGERVGPVVGSTDGDSVTFDVAFCTYRGTVSGSPPDRMSGKESCYLHIGPTDSLFYGGDWAATR